MFKWRQIKTTRRLSDLEIGAAAEIVQVRGKPVLHYYLSSMGLHVGSSIVIEKALTAAPDSVITVRANGKKVLLDKIMAMNIRVQLPVIIPEREIPDLSDEYARVSLVHS